MTIIDDRTTNLNLPLPAQGNHLEDDVIRLRQAFTALDTAWPSKADLVGGKVPASQLPSYVDDVLEFDNLAAFPAAGETGKVYVAIDSGKVYRWSGSAYAAISDFVLVPATPLTLGGVKVGSGLGIDPDGVLYVVGGGGGSGLPVYADAVIVPTSAGQTVFPVPGGYNPGQIDILRNGIELEGNGIDYTASNGTSFTVNFTNTTLLDKFKVRKWIYLPSSMALNKTGDTMTGALNWAAAVDVASAATTQIGLAASNRVRVTGTTTITSLGTIAAGAVRTVTFAGALVLTYNATSLILPGGANITTAAGDVAEFESLGSGNWRCTSYLPAAGDVSRAGSTMTGALNWATTATVASTATTDIGAAASNRVSVTGTTTITALGTIAAGAVRTVTFAGSLLLTHNASSLILPGAVSITTQAGDVAEFESLGSGNWRCTSYTRASGAPAGGLVSTKVSTTSQTAKHGFDYQLENAAATAVTAPAAAEGVEFAVTPANGLTTNTVDFGTDTVRGPAGSASGVITLDRGARLRVRYSSTVSKWVVLQ